MENREKFSSRLGFLLISAGCAIGLGNVWKFPYITGKYGGAAFVLIYFVFLLILGIPILTLELAVGRASQRSVALSMDVLEPKGTKWHWFKFPAMAGNYILMMFYTTVAGWMVYYFFKMAAGGFVGMNADEIGATFNNTLANPTLNVAFMIAVVISCMLIVGKGLQNGVEKTRTVLDPESFQYFLNKIRRPCGGLMKGCREKSVTNCCATGPSGYARKDCGSISIPIFPS